MACLCELDISEGLCNLLLLKLLMWDLTKKSGDYYWPAAVSHNPTVRLLAWPVVSLRNSVVPLRLLRVAHKGTTLASKGTTQGP